MKKILLGFMALTTLIGCSDLEDVKYDDSQAFVAFQRTVYDLKIPLNSTKALDVIFEASNKVDFDRTYQLEIVATETDANPATYTFPSTMTIPANSYTGTLTINGTDGGLVDANVKKLTLRVLGLGDNESTDSDKVIINILEFCPVVVDEFVGDFSSTTFWNGPGVHVVSENGENAFVIEDFFTDDAENSGFEFTYDPENNNTISFEERNTGYFSAANGGYIWIRMSTNSANVSSVDACTGKIGIFVNYFIPSVGSYGDQNEVFTKL